MNRQQKTAERVAEYFREDPLKSMYGNKVVAVDVKHIPVSAPVLQKEGLSMEKRRQTINEAFAWLKHQMVQMRFEDQALLKQLLHMRKTIDKIKKDEEEWKMWEARYQQRFHSVCEEPDGYGRLQDRPVSTPQAKPKSLNSASVPAKGRTLPAPGRQYRQAFIPAPMSPTSPVMSPSSSSSSFTMTSSNADSTVNDTSLLQNFSFQPISPMENSGLLRKSPFMTGKGVRAQSTPNCQVPPPPPEIKESSGPTKYGPVMKRTWSMDNVLSSPKPSSSTSADSGISGCNVSKSVNTGSDIARSGTPSSVSSMSSEVFLDTEDMSISESPSTGNHSISGQILVSRMTMDSGEGADARKVQRLNGYGQAQNDSATPHKLSSRHAGSQFQKLATIADERSPFEITMIDKWSRSDGNTRFVLERRAQRAMARRNMISSEPISPSSRNPPPKPPRDGRKRDTITPTKVVPSREQKAATPPNTLPLLNLRALSVEAQPFRSAQFQNRERMLGDNLLQFDLHRSASDDMLTSQYHNTEQASRQHRRRKSSYVSLTSPQQFSSCKSKSLDWTEDMTPTNFDIQRQSQLCGDQCSPIVPTPGSSEYFRRFRYSFSRGPDAFTTEL